MTKLALILALAAALLLVAASMAGQVTHGSPSAGWSWGWDD